MQLLYLLLVVRGDVRGEAFNGDRVPSPIAAAVMTGAESGGAKRRGRLL